MIEVAYVEGPGIIVSLHCSESGGWERQGRQLPWLGAIGHRHDGLSGLKVFAGDWMVGAYMLTGSALHRAIEAILAYGAVVALLILLYLATAGCASAPVLAPMAPPVAVAHPQHTDAAEVGGCVERPVVTSTASGGARAAIREAWALQRDTAVRWRGIAEKQTARVVQITADLADTRAELARAHARLVESPPPAPPVRSAVLGILLPVGGAALGGGGAALACSEGRCSTVGTSLAVAGSAGLLVGLGAWLAGLSP